LQIQDWLHTRDAAQATVAHALAIASAKKGRNVPAHSPHHDAAALEASSSVPIRSASATKFFKSSESGSNKMRAKSALPSKQQLPSQYAQFNSSRLSSTSRPLPQLSSIDSSIVSIVAGGASGTTAMLRHTKRSSSAEKQRRQGSSIGQQTLPPPSHQLFSVIL
jgi:hypothetical protein